MLEDTHGDFLYASVRNSIWRTATVLFMILIGIGVWSKTANLITTIRASGNLVSSSPSVNIQHLYGGSIIDTNIKLHDKVTKGDVLYQLDTSRLKDNLVQIEIQVNQIKNENKVISYFLAKDSVQISEQEGIVYARYNAMHEQMLLDINKSMQSELNAINQITRTQSAVDVLEHQYEVAEMQRDQTVSFANKGLATTRDANEMIKQALALKANINSEKAELVALKEKMNLARHNQGQLEAKFKIDLLNRLNNNLSRLPELQRQAINIRDEISHSIVKAPITGFIVSVDYQTNGMYIPKGSTIAQIAKPLESPIVRLTIPPQAIEQTKVGMTGILTISSLPQRNLTKIRAKLISIAPDAIKDEMGATIGYSATAEINPIELQAALKKVDTPLHLFSDMPVSLALEGRKITFYDYLAAPFFQIFSGALQD